MTSRKLFTLVGAGLVLAATALTVPAAMAQDAYTIKRVYKAGEVDRYKIAVKVASSTLSIDIAMTMTEKTKEVKDDGTVVVTTSLDSGMMSMGGTDIPMPNEGQTFTITMDKTGKVIKQEGADSKNPVNSMMSMMRNPTPTCALKVGEEVKTDIPIGDDKQKMSVVMKLIGVEKKSAEIPVDTLKVKSQADGALPVPNGPQNVKVDTTSWFEIGTGKMLKVEGTVTGLNMAELGGDAKVTFKRIRLTGDAAATPTKDASSKK